jgi:poly(3-hydroxyoctanoate) depolymerase
VTAWAGHLPVDGLRTRVQVRGDGPPLLLISGLWGQIRMWDDVLPHLAGFRTIAFDPPGIGETQMPSLPYTISRLAGFCGGVLKAAGVSQADVLGVSLGGAIAQQLAHSRPDRVRRLVLVSTSPGAISVPGRPGALLRFLHPTAYASKRNLERHAGAMFGGRLRAHPQLVRRWHFQPPRHLRAYAFRLAGTAGWTSLPWLRRLQTPTLVVHGDDDPIVPLINAQLLAWLIPTARLHVVRGGGHLLLLDSAADVVPTITAFLHDEPTNAANAPKRPERGHLRRDPHTPGPGQSLPGGR